MPLLARISCTVVLGALFAGCNAEPSARSTPASSRQLLSSSSAIQTAPQTESAEAAGFELVAAPAGSSQAQSGAALYQSYFRSQSSAATPAAGWVAYADVVVQPGDSCGARSPTSGPGGACVDYYFPKLNPACGKLSWYATPSADTVWTLTTSSTTTWYDGRLHVSLNVPESTPLGNSTSFTVGATCSNPAYGAGSAQVSVGVVSVALWDETLKWPQAVTTLNDQVGSQEDLRIVVSPAAAKSALQAPNWFVPYATSSPAAAYVLGYVQTNDSAVVTPASPLPTSNPLVYFPIAAYSPLPGSQKLGFTASSGSAGTAFHGELAKYEIEAPSASNSPTTGQAIDGELGTSCGSPYLLVGRDACIHPTAPYGIQWHVEYASPSKVVHGQVGLTQLTSSTIFSYPSPIPGNSAPPAIEQTTYGVYDLDSHVQFGENGGPKSPSTVTLPANGTVIFPSNDSPGAPLLDCLDTLYLYDLFEDYYNFTPDAKNGHPVITVTLATSTWGFYVYASRPDGEGKSVYSQWSTPGEWIVPSSTALAPDTTLPVWTNDAQTLLASQTAPC